MALDIVNKSGIPKPAYVDDLLRQICWKANIAPNTVCLILKKRTGGYKEYPSGSYLVDCHTIIVRIGRDMAKENLAFVLAHEIGHLKAHREAKPIERLRRLTMKDYGEHKANHFALQVCNCYPNPEAKYQGTVRLNKRENK